MPNINSFEYPFFFFSSDRNCVIQFASPSIEQILGYKPEIVVGRRYTDFLVRGHAMNQGIADLQKRRFEGDCNHSSLCLATNSFGQRRVLRFQTYGEVDSSGTVIANHGLVEDVSDEHSVEDEVGKRFEHLSELENLLTDRELDVLEKVLSGRLNKSIARELGVSERAIEMTRSRLMNKFNAETSAQLIAMASELNTLKSILQTRVRVA